MAEKVQFGLKLWSTNVSCLIQAIELVENDTFDYVELMPVPNTHLSVFLERKIPYIIHCATDSFGLNIADKKKREFNLRTINECIHWMDMLEAKYLIIHPGYGNIEDSLDFLDEITDRRILIENMPRVGLSGEMMVGYSINQIRLLISTKFGFCLDLNHAVKAAISLNLSYERLIAEFLRLSPQVFHISDGRFIETDEHLPVGLGSYDFGFLMKCIKSSKLPYVTLETPRRDLTSFNEDLINLKKLVSYV